MPRDCSMFTSYLRTPLHQHQPLHQLLRFVTCMVSIASKNSNYSNPTALSSMKQGIEICMCAYYVRYHTLLLLHSQWSHESSETIELATWARRTVMMMTMMKQSASLSGLDTCWLERERAPSGGVKWRQRGDVSDVTGFFLHQSGIKHDETSIWRSAAK